jgi:hypothetical protein
LLIYFFLLLLEILWLKDGLTLDVLVVIFRSELLQVVIFVLPVGLVVKVDLVDHDLFFDLLSG